MDTISKYLEGLFGLEAVVGLIILGLLAKALWTICKKFYEYKNKSDSLPCHEHETSISQINQSLHSIQISLSRIEEKLRGHERLFGILANIPSSGQLTQHHSPLNLSDKGRNVAVRLQFDKIIEENWALLSTIPMDKENPYDIQSKYLTELILFPEKYLPPKEIDKIKHDAYQNGLELSDYMRALAVMARDKYIELL